MHSHTHTDAYPSPTDVAQAPDPGWHYVIVSLRDPEPVVRSYRIVDGNITEMRLTIRIAVVLPQPDGPTSTQISPAGTVSDSFSTAGSRWPG